MGKEAYKLVLGRPIGKCGFVIWLLCGGRVEIMNRWICQDVVWLGSCRMRSGSGREMDLGRWILWTWADNGGWDCVGACALWSW